MKKIPLTIVILTNISDVRFENALKSAQFAEEIVVVDNNSQNNWKELKKEYQFTIIPQNKRISDYSLVRNNALNFVKTNWVMFLDSDEVLPNNALKEILNIISSDLYNAVAIKRTDYFLGKKLRFGETGSQYLIRLFKTNSGKFVRHVHETVNIEERVGRANFEIDHFSHTSISDFLRKISEYAKLESKNKNITKTENIIQMIIFPIFKFILNYFIKLGFLDGYRGIVYAFMMSLHSFFVRIYYYEKQI